ncbi:MAG: hypothetical protein LBP65_00195 [Puniceicoccales bacterium]|jgi:hypothetical protein|nr:hypothetical protein [Puniceicoccales bacterium]
MVQLSDYVVQSPYYAIINDARDRQRYLTAGGKTRVQDLFQLVGNASEYDRNNLYAPQIGGGYEAVSNGEYLKRTVGGVVSYVHISQLYVPIAAVTAIISIAIKIMAVAMQANQVLTYQMSAFLDELERGGAKLRELQDVYKMCTILQTNMDATNLSSAVAIDANFISAMNKVGLLANESEVITGVEDVRIYASGKVDLADCNDDTQWWTSGEYALMTDGSTLNCASSAEAFASLVYNGLIKGLCKRLDINVTDELLSELVAWLSTAKSYSVNTGYVYNSLSDANCPEKYKVFLVDIPGEMQDGVRGTNAGHEMILNYLTDILNKEVFPPLVRFSPSLFEDYYYSPETAIKVTAYNYNAELPFLAAFVKNFSQTSGFCVPDLSQPGGVQAMVDYLSYGPTEMKANFGTLAIKNKFQGHLEGPYRIMVGKSSTPALMNGETWKTLKELGINDGDNPRNITKDPKDTLGNNVVMLKEGSDLGDGDDDAADDKKASRKFGFNPYDFVKTSTVQDFVNSATNLRDGDSVPMAFMSLSNLHSYMDLLRSEIQNVNSRLELVNQYYSRSQEEQQTCLTLASTVMQSYRDRLLTTERNMR